MKTNKIKILGIGGSLEKHSSTFAALKFTIDTAGSLGAETGIIDLKKLKLPIYDPSKGNAQGGTALKKILVDVHTADAYIFASPEYHGTVSGAFKNLLDYFEFLSPYSPPYLSGKPCGAIAIGGGDSSGGATLQTIINVIHSFRGIAAPGSLSISSSQLHFNRGVLTGEIVKKRLNRLAAEVFMLTSKLK